MYLTPRDPCLSGSCPGAYPSSPGHAVDSCTRGADARGRRQGPTDRRQGQLLVDEGGLLDGRLPRGVVGSLCGLFSCENGRRGVGVTICRGRQPAVAERDV